MPNRIFRHLPVIAATLMAASAPALAAVPNHGCQTVDALDVTNLTNPGVYAMASGFTVGDRIVFTVSGTDAELEVTNNAHQIVLTVPATPTPQSVTFTVSSADDARLDAALVPAGSVPSLTVTAHCASALKNDASRGAVQGFLAARINGILLNDPGATSLMSRTNSTVPGNVANAGNGATNVASNATAFGKAMGLGSGLGNAMGLGANALGDDGAIDASGGKTIQ